MYLIVWFKDEILLNIVSNGRGTCRVWFTSPMKDFHRADSADLADKFVEVKIFYLANSAKAQQKFPFFFLINRKSKIVFVFVIKVGTVSRFSEIVKSHSEHWGKINDEIILMAYVSNLQSFSPLRYYWL